MNQSTTRAQAIALHRIAIASPCTASWDQMKGDERVRHCDDCNKNVFNLSAMPEAEAAALLADNHSGKLCVRFYRRQDGTVMTSDCSASPRAQVRKAWRKLPGMAGAAVLVLSAAGSAASEPVPVQVATMGAPPAPTVAAEIPAKKSEAAPPLPRMGKPVHQEPEQAKPADKLR